MEMAQRVKVAKARRSKLLIDFLRSGETKVKFAKKHKMTAQRMGKLLNVALMENGG